MTPLQEIVYQAVKDAGADGLCDTSVCGCGLDDFAPCGDGPYSDCEFARYNEFDNLYYPIPLQLELTETE